MKIHRFAVMLAVLSVVLAGFSGLGVRVAWWPYAVGFTLLRWVVGLGLAAIVCGVIGLVIPRWRSGVVLPLVVSIVLGAAAGWLPWQLSQQAKSLPRIHDISTDLINPPPFVDVMPLRASAPNPAVYGGAQVAAAQRTAYPDIQPLLLNETSDRAYVLALAEAKKADWDIVAQDPQHGRIEATATTFWFGFKDDIVIRITPVDGRTRIDMRSVSRVGKSDLGKNAARIRSTLASLAHAAASAPAK